MNSLEDIRVFTGMNLDDDEVFLKEGEYREAQNCRIYTSEGSDKGSIQNYLGNALVSYTLSIGTNRVVGSCKDTANGRIYYFVYNSTGRHAILRYDIEANTIEEVEAENEYLNFQEDHIITANIIGDLLFWTDGYDNGFDDINPPRMLNVRRAYNRHHGIGNKYVDRYNYDPTLPLHREFLDRAKRPPWFAPLPAYVDDTSYNKNNLRGKLFQFAYRYIYDNNEYSTFSPIGVSDLPTGEMTVLGNFNEDQTHNNRLNVIFLVGGTLEDSGLTWGYTIKKIEITAREGNDGHWRIVKVFDRYDEDGVLLTDSAGNTLTESAARVYYFYNEVAGYNVVQEDVFKISEYVPQVSQAQDIVEKSRIVDANITEGYDGVELDVTLGVDYGDDFDLRGSIYLQNIVGGFSVIEDSPPTAPSWTYYIIVFPAVHTALYYFNCIRGLSPTSYEINFNRSTQTNEEMRDNFILSINSSLSVYHKNLTPS